MAIIHYPSPISHIETIFQMQDWLLMFTGVDAARWILHTQSAAEGGVCALWLGYSLRMDL